MSGFYYIDFSKLKMIEEGDDYFEFQLNDEMVKEIQENKKPIIIENFTYGGLVINSVCVNSVRVTVDIQSGTYIVGTASANIWLAIVDLIILLSTEQKSISIYHTQRPTE